jgi:hypothetical protein
MINTNVPGGSSKSIFQQMASLEAARKNSPPVKKQDNLSPEYNRLVDTFQVTLINVMALDGSERDQDPAPAAVNVSDLERGEILGLKDSDHSTVVSSYYANGTSVSAPGTLTVFKVDKERNELNVFEYGDISGHINPAPREDLVKVKHTKLDLAKAEAVGQNMMWENDASTLFLEGDCHITMVRRAHGHRYG